MVHTQLEQIAKLQNDLLYEMNNKVNDRAVRVVTRGGRMTQEPLYPKGQPKRIEQDSQRNNIEVPSSSKKKKKKKNDRTLHASSEAEIENLLRIIMMFLFLMLRHNLVMNTHLVIMIMMFMLMLNQIMM
jgi:hypothetical protein